MFIIGLHRHLSAQVKDAGIGPVLIEIGGPVVVDLVIIPGHQPGRGGVGGLKVDVHLVLGIATAIIAERIDLAAKVLTDRFGRPIRPAAQAVAAPLVDVVAIAEHEIRLLACEIAVRGEPALFIILAAGNAEAHPVDRLADRGRGHRASSPAALASGVEAVPVGASRQEPANLDMHRMTKLGTRQRRARGDDVAHARGARYFPLHFHRSGRHAVANLEGVGREPGPDHEAIRGGIARRDAELEGVGAKHRRGDQLRKGRQPEPGQRGGPKGLERMAAAQFEPGRADVGHVESPFVDGCWQREGSGQARFRMGAGRRIKRAPPSEEGPEQLSSELVTDPDLRPPY